MAGITLSLEGCNALVTGASSGLGTFLATALDAAGASVAVHYHDNKAGAEELAHRLSNPSVVVQADLKVSGGCLKKRRKPLDHLTYSLTALPPNPKTFLIYLTFQTTSGRAP